MKWTQIESIEKINDMEYYVYFPYGVAGDSARTKITLKTIRYLRKRFKGFYNFEVGMKILPTRVFIKYDELKPKFKTYRIIDLIMETKK